MKSESNDFWDSKWSNVDLFKIDAYDFGEFNIVLKKISYPLQNKNILDLGSGRGEISVYLAGGGANVTAVDSSSEAIEFIKALAKFNNVEINAFKMDVFEIDRIGIKFDLIVGKFILHHIEPFKDFPFVLKNAMNENGTAIFYENNARNKILMFFRKYFTGRFGIPKYGDAFEHPFELSETMMLKNVFNQIRTSYPKFLFFEMLAPYIFKNNKKASMFFKKIDSFLFKLKFLNKYSYVQIIEIENAKNDE